MGRKPCQLLAYVHLINGLKFFLHISCFSPPKWDSSNNVAQQEKSV